MPLTHEQILSFLKSVHPYDALPLDALSELVPQFDVWKVARDFAVYDFGGEKLPGAVSYL